MSIAKKKVKLFTGFSAIVALGAGVPTAAAFAIRNNSNKQNNGLNVNESILKQEISKTNDTTKLEGLLNSSNQEQIKNELISSGVIDENSSSLINQISFKLSDNTKQIPGENIKIDLSITTNDAEPIIFEEIPTGVHIVNFNKSEFLAKFANENINTLSDKLSNTHILETIYGFNVGFDKGSLLSVDSSLSSNSEQLPQSSWLVDFIIKLTSSYVFKTSDNVTIGIPTFSDKLELNGCQTSSSQNIDINTTKLIENIKNLINFNETNNLLSNVKDLNNFVNNSDVVINNDWIKENSISTSVDSNNNLCINVTIKLFNEKTSSTGAIPTKIKVVNFSESILKSYFENFVNNSDLISNDNLINTLVKSNSGFLSNDYLNDKTTITNNGTYESNAIPYNKYNLTLYLNDGYCFLEQNNVISCQKNVIDLLTKIQASLKPNTSMLINTIHGINRLDSLNNLLSMNSENLLNFVRTQNIINNPNLITSCTLSNVVEENKVKLKFIISFNDGTSVTVNEFTGMNVVTYNEDEIRKVFLSVSSYLDNTNLINKLAETNPDLSLALSNQTLMTTISGKPYVDISNIPYVPYNLNLFLNSNYCFLINDKYVDNANILDVNTGIRYNYNYSIQNVENHTKTLNSIDLVNNAKNSTEFLNILKKYNFVKNANWISRVDILEYSNLEGYVAIGAKITWTDKTSNDLFFKTGLKSTPKFDNNNNFISELSKCDSKTSVEELERNFNSNPTNFGFPENSIKSLVLSENSYYNVENVPYNKYNTSVVLNSGFAYIDEKNNLQSEFTVNDCLSLAPYTISFNWTTFDDECYKITGSIEMGNVLFNLKTYLIQWNVLEDSNWISNVSYSYNIWDATRPSYAQGTITILLSNGVSHNHNFIFKCPIQIG